MSLVSLGKRIRRGPPTDIDAELAQLTQGAETTSLSCIGTVFSKAGDLARRTIGPSSTTDESSMLSWRMSSESWLGA